MLPSHLLDPTRKRNERPSHTRLGGPPPPPLPSLCVTGAMSRIGRYQVAVPPDGGAGGGDNKSDADCVVLSYIIFRPRQLHDAKRPPLLCLHGGPSVPSNYLLPIVNGVTDRAVILYDQWGCGKSSRPRMTVVTGSGDGGIGIGEGGGNGGKPKPSVPPFSIPTMVEHLRQLVEDCWKIDQFHMLGHSFGGILAFEYLKLLQLRSAEEEGLVPPSPRILSLVLSSSPTSAALVRRESERLHRALGGGGGDGSRDDDGSDGDDNRDGDDGGDADGLLRSEEEFRQTHECRLPQLPLALTDALAQAGPTPWRGVPAIADYHASGTVVDVPTLLLRGEYDFCTEACLEGWTERIVPSRGKQRPAGDGGAALPLVEAKTLSNCSHYAMLEDEGQYGGAVLGFLRARDPA